MNRCRRRMMEVLQERHLSLSRIGCISRGFHFDNLKLAISGRTAWFLKVCWDSNLATYARLLIRHHTQETIAARISTSSSDPIAHSAL
jgi:hypothetical protein